MDGGFFPEAEAVETDIAPGLTSRKLRARGGSLMLVEMRFATGASAPFHDHAHEQATYCLEGEFVFRLGEEERPLRPGDSVYVPGGLGHSIRCLAAGRVLDSFTPQREDFLPKD